MIILIVISVKKKFSSKYNLEIHNLNCIKKNFNDQKESYEEKIKN